MVGRKQHLWAALGLCVITALAYANSFQSGFVYDNRTLILNDPRIREFSWENIQLIFSHTYWWPAAEHGLYRPLSTLSHLFNYAVLGNADRPAGYHVVNLALHLANVLLVYALGLRLVRRFWPAVVLAAIWAVHPVLTESVTNIIGRSDALAAMAVLGGLLCHLRAVEARGRARLTWPVVLAMTTLVGVFSKESAIVIPGVIVLYEIAWWTNASRRRLSLGALAVVPPIVLMLVVRSIVIGQGSAAEFHFVDNPIVDASFVTGRLTAIRVIAQYLWRIAWPATLSADYSYAQVPLATGTALDWLGWVTVATLAGAIVSQRRRAPLYFFFAAFAFLTFLPASNLIFTTGTIMADRLMYLPSVGVIACVVLAIDALATRLSWRWAVPVAAGAIVVALSVRTWQRNLDWRDDLSLWSSAAQASPNSHQTHRALASLRFAQDPAHANMTDVLAEADKAVAILDGLPDRQNATDVYADAGFYYEQHGEALARKDASGALVSTPESARAYARALALLERGVAIDRAVSADYVRQEVARGRLESDVAPVGLPVLYERLALTAVRLGDAPKAIEAARYARLVAPLLPETHSVLVWTLSTLDRRDDAAVALAVKLLMTKDTKAIGQMQALYGSGLDTQGCAIAQTSQGTTLNQSCPIVRQHLCAATADIVEIYRWNRRPDLAAEAEKRAGPWGCKVGK